MKLKKVALAAAVAAGALATGFAHANLVLVAPENFSGTGLGAVNTVLTIQSPANSTFEQGSVGREVGNPNDVITGDAMTGASQTQTRTLGELGIASAANLRVVFNALEPGNDANSVLLSSLQLLIFSPTGSLLFDSDGLSCPSLGGSCNFADTFTGTGNSGFVFALDETQQGLAAAAFNNPLNRVGLSASVDSATGGFETFFVANSAGTVVTPIPEPETYALMMAGLGAIGFMARRRKQKQS